MMNLKRLAIAYLAVLVAANLYEFVVFGVALRGFHGAYPDLLRTKAELKL